MSELFQYPAGWEPISTGVVAPGDRYLYVPMFAAYNRVLWYTCDAEDDIGQPVGDYELIIRKKATTHD